MPRPPTLPVLDWKEIFDKGTDWQAWLNNAESAEQAGKMRERFDKYPVPQNVQECLQKLARPVHVVAIAEDWCGDVVRHAPVIARIAESSPQVKLRFITRADRPDVFARFLTNGGEAIPKFVFLNSDFVECGNWGPMPSTPRQFIARGKAIGDVAAGRAKVREFYAADEACETAYRELCDLVQLAGATSID